MSKRLILSLDGGGIRGIITACVLAAIEEQTGKLMRDLLGAGTDKPASASGEVEGVPAAEPITGMVAGTSTGALQAAAIAVGLPAREMLRIYVERSKEIFQHHLITTELDYITKGWKYQSQAIASVLAQEFGKCATWTLNDSPIRLLLTAVHVSGKPLYFVQDRPQNKQLHGKLSLIDCACASAAAPTYFTSYYVAPLGGQLVGRCFDGGSGVLADPSHRACVEAFYFDNFVPENTRLLSFGTGYYTPPTPRVNAPEGLLAMVSWVIDSLLGAAHDEQGDLVDLYYPGLQRRLNWPLPRAIDMADTSAIHDLVTIGTEAAKTIDWAALSEINGQLF